MHIDNVPISVTLKYSSGFHASYLAFPFWWFKHLPRKHLRIYRPVRVYIQCAEDVFDDVKKVLIDGGYWMVLHPRDGEGIWLNGKKLAK